VREAVFFGVLLRERSRDPLLERDMHRAHVGFEAVACRVWCMVYARVGHVFNVFKVSLQ
jgi:hypothetical protein